MTTILVEQADQGLPLPEIIHDMALPLKGPDAVDPFMQKPIALLDTAFNLFGYLPADDDFRWAFLQKYTTIRDEHKFKALNFENAWGATYLSAEHSWRSGYVNTINPENILQLDRALDNLEHRTDVFRRFEVSQGDDGLDIRLKLTDALVTNTDKRLPAETPCPEALYQLRLYVGRYLGRVGFNLHREHGESVVSIVNVQGVPGSKGDLESFQDTHGLNPFNYLVRLVKTMAHEDEAPMQIRGIVNPKRGNSRLYYGVFKTEDVPTYKVRHKPRYKPPQ